MKAALAAGMLAVLLVLPARASADTWTVAGLTFSDELGGFRIVSVSGSGTVSDPIVIVEEITDIVPAVLIIRGVQLYENQGSDTIEASFTNLAMVKVVTNLSERTWIGFDLELQEEFRRPSPYDDGLSFDQLGVFKDPPVRSDRFAINRRESEPYDRVRFEEGSVNPGQSARLRFYITDPTPAGEFFLLQEPRLVVAQAPTPGRQLAAVGRRGKPTPSLAP
jgi:hypothetical protein